MSLPFYHRLPTITVIIVTIYESATTVQFLCSSYLQMLELQNLGCTIAGGAPGVLDLPPKKEAFVMKKTKFSEEQIVGILKEGEAGISVTELCRKYGMSDATYYNWKAKYAGMAASDRKG